MKNEWRTGTVTALDERQIVTGVGLRRSIELAFFLYYCLLSSSLLFAFNVHSMATDGKTIVPLLTSQVEPNPDLLDPSTAPIVQIASPSHPPKSKRKRPDSKAAKPLKIKTRSDVWEHFERFHRPIMEVLDGKKQEVGREVRAKCREHYGR